MAKVWDSVKADYRRIKEGQAGTRFRDYRESKRDRPFSVKNLGQVAVVVLGIVLVFIGAAIGWLPGPGGFLAVIGLILLAPYVPGAAPILDYSERALRKVIAVVRGWFKRRPSNEYPSR